MGYVQPLRVSDRAPVDGYLSAYLRDGYAIIRGLFGSRLAAAGGWSEWSSGRAITSAR
jgi:hypothetical protein